MGASDFVLATPSGDEVAFHGRYLDIVPDHHITYTEVFEVPGTDGDDTNAPVNTVTFEPFDGGTRLALLVQTTSTQLRDAIINSGMETGMRGQMDRIDELATSLT